MSDYTYQVARIRALETGLLGKGDIERLIACPDAGSCVRFLEEKGWGTSETAGDPDRILAYEEEQIWNVIGDLHIDVSMFDVLEYPKVFHDVKAAVKAVATGQEDAARFYGGVGASGEELMDAVREKDFDRLPCGAGKAAEEAYEELLHTGDGQLCDVTIDRACLDAIMRAGEDAAKKGEPVIKDYAISYVSICDVKTAARSAATGKSAEFMEKAIAETPLFSKDELIKAALSGKKQVIDYLETTDLRDGAAALAEGASAFERWCDDRMTDSLQSEKYETFTIGPVLAYVIARQNEIKTARIIITGKANGLSDDEIRARARKMYV